MKDDRYLELRNKTVTKSNDLIQKSRFSLSLLQQKIILCLISQITPYDNEFKLYEFSVIDFCKACGIDCENGKNYRDLKLAIKELADKSLWIKINEDEETLLRWIEKPYVNKSGGTVKVRLDRDMMPFLLQLKQNFTQYEIIWTLHFKSKYSIRLYELVKSIHYHELEFYRKRFTVDELKSLLDGEKYKEYRDFKRRVLAISIDEVNRYSDKTVSFEEVKRGKKVVAVEFTISSKDSLSVLQIRSDIEREFGLDQITLWDNLEENGQIDPSAF